MGPDYPDQNYPPNWQAAQNAPNYPGQQYPDGFEQQEELNAAMAALRVSTANVPGTDGSRARLRRISEAYRMYHGASAWYGQEGAWWANVYVMLSRCRRVDRLLIASIDLCAGHRGTR